MCKREVRTVRAPTTTWKQTVIPRVAATRVTRDVWRVTRDVWHVTCDVWILNVSWRGGGGVELCVARISLESRDSIENYTLLILQRSLVCTWSRLEWGRALPAPRSVLPARGLLLFCTTAAIIANFHERLAFTLICEPHFCCRSPPAMSHLIKE